MAWIGDSSVVENAPVLRRALVVLAVGLAGLLAWLLAAVGWVDWSAVGDWLAVRAGWFASLAVVLGLVGTGGWSLLQHRHSPARDRPRAAVSWWMVAAALFIVAMVAWIATGWLLSEADHARDVAATRVDAIKTGLSVAAGTGGVFALLLAVRRQWHQELTAQDIALDASERRVTDLYTKAADQLGSDKAPVRLAGLYAFERLAQDNPTQRQTVVNVLCAYLRMPYQPPEQTQRGGVNENDLVRDDSALHEAAPDDDTNKATTQAASEQERRIQEREVRLTAQRILADHLDPGDDPRRTSPTFWPDSDLDLTGAMLIDFVMSGVQARTVRFAGATFIGDAGFDGTTFNGDAWFGQATFTKTGRFRGTTFDGIAVFDEATFIGPVSFSRATFTRIVGFDAAAFNADAGFGRTTFDEEATFSRATFTEDAGFYEATFNGDAAFTGATFTGPARFSRASFNGRASFDEVTFTGPAGFDRTAFSGPARFGFDKGTLIGDTLADALFTTDSSHLLPPGLRLVSSPGIQWSVARRTNEAEGTHTAAPRLIATDPPLSSTDQKE